MSFRTIASRKHDLVRGGQRGRCPSLFRLARKRTRSARDFSFSALNPFVFFVPENHAAGRSETAPYHECDVLCGQNLSTFYMFCMAKTR